MIEPVLDEAIQTANCYLEALKIRGSSIATIRAYAFDLLLFFRWFGKRKIEFEKLNDLVLLDWISHQRTVEARPNSINRRLSAVSMFYEYCFAVSVPRSKMVPYKKAFVGYRNTKGQQGLQTRRNFIEQKLRVPNERKLIRPLEIEQVKLFLENIHRYRDMSIVLLMLFCGLRTCEVISLKFEDIDFEQRKIRVTGKGEKERVIPFPDRLKYVFKKYIRYERPERCLCKNFFVTLQGQRRGYAMKSEGVRKVFRTRRKSASLKNANPHSWRHSFGTNMARQGVQLPILQKMMGHSNFKMTMRYINLSMHDVVVEYDKAIAVIEKRYV